MSTNPENQEKNEDTASEYAQELLAVLVLVWLFLRALS